MTAPDYERYRRAVAGHPLPLAFVDLDRFDDNARALLRRAKGKPIRVASKSLRCRALIERALSVDGFRGVLAFTPREAAFLAAHGLDDLLVAYPSIHPAQVGPLLDEVAAGKRLSVTIDSEAHVTALGRMAEAREVVLPVTIDLDASLRLPGLHFGVRRSPLSEPNDVVALAKAVSRHPSLRVEGLLAYEAQIAGLPNAVPGKRLFNRAVRLLQARSRRELFRRRGAVVSAMRAEGFMLRYVNGGGTGSLEITTADPSVDELSAGSGLLGPGLFDGYRGFTNVPASGFALEVSRRPAPGMVTCLGGGYVASGSSGDDKLPTPWLPEGLALLPAEGAGEVQTPLAGAHSLAIGEPVFFRHAKSGELAERFDRLMLIRGDEVVGEAPTYRGEGRCFL